ncbi:hypothetical protein ACIO6T_30835 [Streptomyces sp. NPDC087532]|uniref:hypothetical protein n=1 Tax=Streptomyces sp. NPDC087532 TaxID=3365795 RepID=UPI00382E9EEC
MRVRVSNDGTTWQPLPARELLADAERALHTADQAALMKGSLVIEAGPCAEAVYRRSTHAGWE